MPKLVPINDVRWIVTQARRAGAYGQKARLRLYFLSGDRASGPAILPEHFVNERVFDVELMLICLKNGAWLNGAPWQPYVRYTIAKRLKARQDKLFRGEVLKYKEDILSYQLRGGLLADRDKLRKLAHRLIGPQATLYDRSVAQLIASITDSIEENTLVQPFHWIRTTIAATEMPLVGMNLYTAENILQKQTLSEMLKATV